MAHVGQEGRFELVGLLGALLGGDQLLFGLLECRDVVIDPQHVDDLFPGAVVPADEVGLDPGFPAVVVQHAADGRCRLHFTRREARQQIEQDFAVFGVDVAVFADHVDDLRRVGLPVVAQPYVLRIALFIVEVVVGISYLGIFGDDAEQGFELRNSVLDLPQLGVVDIDEQVVGEFAPVVVQAAYAPRPVEMPRARAFVVAAEFSEFVTGGEIRTFAVPDADFVSSGKLGLSNRLSPRILPGSFTPNDLQVAGVDVDEPSPVVVDLDANGGVAG